MKCAFPKLTLVLQIGVSCTLLYTYTCLMLKWKIYKCECARTMCPFCSQGLGPLPPTNYLLRFPAHITPSSSEAHISSPSSKSPSSTHLFRPRPKAEATSQASHLARSKWSTWTHGPSSSAFQKNPLFLNVAG